MEEEALTERIRRLFDETTQAYHHAFLESNSVNLAWPLWYADYVQDRLSTLFHKEIYKEDIVYLLVLLSDGQPNSSSNIVWSVDNIQRFIDHFA